MGRHANVMTMKWSFNIFVLALMVLAACADPGKPELPAESYKIDTVPTPDGLTAEVGGLDFLSDGRLIACFIRGEVMIYDPKTRQWTLFAEGLQEPLGILRVTDSEFLVMQRPELTRIKDTDGDGQADEYENATDDFGISGNYHEFNYGPVADKEGNLFIGLNTASHGGGILPELRGAFNKDGRDGDNGRKQMYSVVPYRGWIMKLTPSGKLEPYCSGFRSPNGLGFDLEGNLFVTDNQGDWVGTSPLFHAEQGKFYGHPASLVWEEGWTKGNPFELPPAELDRMRSKAAVLFPHGIMANSPSEPRCDITGGKFGPFAGQLFVGEMNQGRIVRVMLEQVGGEWQGACIPFADNIGLRKGNNRLVFAPDGSLWVGQAEHGWLGDAGIQRISFTGRTPTDVLQMHITGKGFDLEFTQALDSSGANPANYQVRRYRYEYHKKYGSDQIDVQDISVNGAALSGEGKKVSLSLGELSPGYVYEFKLGDIKGRDGTPLANKTICYTVNRLREGGAQ